MTESDNYHGRLAERLRTSAEAITDEWLRHLKARLGVRPRRLLPTDELRDHVPVVLENAAETLESPMLRPPSDSVDILRTLAQLRREQGYDIEELLVEFDILSDLVFERVATWSQEEEPGPSGAEAMHAARRLNAVLRSIVAVAVGTYRDEEVREGHELAAGLADFAATLAHELRNPLSVADMSAELLARSDIVERSAEAKKHVGRIRDRLERIGQLLDDVGTLSAAEHARSRARWQPVGDVVSGVFDEVRATADRLGVELAADGPAEDFAVDAVRIEVALMNLVNNAVKFSDPAKPERWVRVSCGPAETDGLPGGHRIVVADNGRGIDDNLGTRVFERFVRGHPDVEGTGLGLQITKRMVEQLGGRIWFESEPGEGTTFYMEFRQGLDRDLSDEGIEQR